MPADKTANKIIQRTSGTAAASLQDLFDRTQIIADPVELLVYEVDAAQDRGTPQAVVIVHSTDDAARLVRWASEQGLPIVSRGAGTGLSGGAVAEQGGIIAEFSRMNRILEVDRLGRSAVLEPGVVNGVFDERVKSLGLYYPPDPASGRSSTMGGNAAENAGGPHCFKYGVTTNYITGLEFVLPDGQVIQTGGRAYDYPEYDFSALLTGSEGTLGVITRIMVRLLRQPPGVKTLMAAFASVEQAGKAVSAIIAAGLVPATMEMMDQKIAGIIEDYAKPGLPTTAGAILIVEVDGHPASLEPQCREITAIIEQNGGYDVQVARDAAERDRIWFGRKSAAGAMARLAPAYLLLDGTVPRSRLAEALEATNRICEENDLRVGYVFHAGDGNLHPFILLYPKDPDQVARAHLAGRLFMEEVTRLGGSITGEHGVGIEKRPYMSLMYSDQDLEVMRDVKQVFDPGGIFNPGKIFPDQTSTPLDETVPTAAPPGIFAPATLEVASRGLAALSRVFEGVFITGKSPDHLAAVYETRHILSTGQLSEILHYAPDDLYVTVQAGTTLAALQAFLEKEGRQAAAVSPWPGATIGGLLAANVNAPSRMRYGSLRDQVLAMTIILGDGRQIRAGRPVVKNVAGYDLPKLMIGAHGTLGLIAEVTLRVTSLPRAQRTLYLPLETLEQGLEYAGRCLPAALNASGIVLSKGVFIPGLPRSLKDAPYLLTYSVEGAVEDVEAELEEVKEILQAGGSFQAVESGGAGASEIWANLLAINSDQTVKVRAGVAPKDLPAYLQAQADPLSAGDFVLDIASGLVYAQSHPDGLGEAQAWLENLRRPAVALGGYAVVIHAPQEWEPKLNRWGYKPQTLELMQRLKARWDPNNILNPGCFVVG